MVFSSIFFLLYFLPVFLLGYHFINQKYKNYWILIASIFFYAWGAPLFVFVILGSIVLQFYFVNCIDKSSTIRSRKRWLTASIVLNLGMLAYFKYANFFVDNLNSFLNAFGVDQVQWTKVALPIGISFFTFQSITYGIDVYRKEFKPVKKLSDYALYILSFPQMIAGPIVKYKDIALQLENRNETIDDKLIGFYRFCLGLAKKVLIANVMAAQADSILNGDIATLSSATVWLGILAYTFQIYFDFSGYSDMAIGLGKMIGFKFPENFDSPYTSSSITEFWRRWHMTLGAFMKEYLYIPLGGNRVSSNARLYFNLATVFLLSGLWHGASWNFVLWGAFHGLFLILDRMFFLKLLKKVGKWVSIPLTFFIVMVGWAIFRMENFESLQLVMHKLFSFDGISLPEFSKEFITLLIIAIFFSFITLSSTGKKLQNYFLEKDVMSLKQHALMIPIALIFFILSLSAIAASGFNPFIYYRF